MKRAIIISLIICVIIGLLVSIYDILNPIMPDEAAYTDPNNWNSPVLAKEFWSYAIETIGLWIGLSALILFLPCFLIILLFKKFKSKFVVDSCEKN